jgi:protein-S-isoprenylcysteine O-methyltransferase Ste14
MTITCGVAYLIAGWSSLTYLWGMCRYFRQDRTAQTAKRMTKVSATVSTVLFWMALVKNENPPFPLRLAGIVVLLLASGLFWWSIWAHGRVIRPRFAFSQEMPERLVISGPYRVVRHPLYLAYGVAWAGGVLLTANPWLLIPLLWMNLLYYRAACREEQVILCGPLSKAYAQYRAATGMFLPAFRPWTRASGQRRSASGDEPKLNSLGNCNGN